MPDISVNSLDREFVISCLNTTSDAWYVGRAGMQYRDLIPARLGGRFIASHIRIPDGGETPDYVHYHKALFQMIYCKAGWARVVYEDQGPPFLLEAGDCVLQPPRIRHRVLESSAGMEVIEVGCPANHETFADHELPLPTAAVRPERDFGGQRFVRHVASKASWRPFRLEGFECRDTGIADATDGIAAVRVARVKGARSEARYRHDADFVFTFLLSGSMSLALEGTESRSISAGTALVLPPGK